MPTVKAKLGIRCKVYVNTNVGTGAYTAPTWGEATCVSDWTQSPDWDVAEVLSRATRVKQGVKTMLGLTWNGKIKASDDDAVYAKIIAALVSDDALDVLILNGPMATNGVTGYRCDVQVVSGTEDQGTGAVLYDEIKLMPTPTENVPKSVLVTGGTPVLTPLAP